MLLNEVFLCRWKSPRAHSASELKYLQLMNEMCHHSFHLVSPYGPLLSHSHTHTHAPHWWDNLILMVIFYSYLDRDSSFFFSFLRIISADHSSSHYFSSDYLKHLGIMKPWDMEKSFSLFSIHMLVLLTHDPWPRRCICLSCVWCQTPSWNYLSLPRNYLSTSPFIIAKINLWAQRAKPHPQGQHCRMWGSITLSSTELSVSLVETQSRPRTSRPVDGLEQVWLVHLEQQTLPTVLT